ncbi:metal-dependent hydrolase [Novosphingobium sp. MD-1]|uniref:metal-dependent hydrolase n=1 Tax=Novosphingobium sp. MD-1 TaxID=1630648 RepID=UPI00061CD469|nr:metal-dependent hydrolase [Novosphingobium sp. MD-1]GAO55674.1 membrane-bound metal-dependent hydrolase [Novosphingobium sp. MD-1]
MDNLTHSLVGWALAETGLKRRTRKGLAATVLAANLPDIDVFFGWVPWPPLAMHRGFTHGLIGGVLVLPPVLAILLWLLDRWQARRGRLADDSPPMRFGWLLALCWIGALTHPLLDLQNVYAIQLLSPASARWFHTDGLFIISPWLLAMLGLGIWRARRHGRRQPAILALAGTALFIGGNIGISALAWAAPTRDAPYAAPDRIFAGPEPLLFWRRDVVWRQNGFIVQGRYDPLRRLEGLVDVGAPMADRMQEPLVRRAAQATAPARKFLAWSQMPVARVEQGHCRAVVTFGDARFTGPAMSRNFNAVVTLPVDGAGCGGG